MSRPFGWDLPPGVTSAMIEAQVSEEVEAEATCPRGHRATHGGYPEERTFVIPHGDQQLVVDDVDPPEGVGQQWAFDGDGTDRVVAVLGYHLTCEKDKEASEPGGPAQDQTPGGDICGAEWWVAAPLAEVERWEANLAAERAADDAMERTQFATDHSEHCTNAAGMRPEDAWPGLLFTGTGIVCGPWEGPAGVEAYLLANGYTAGYAGNPAAVVPGVDIDRNVAATTPCSACGATGGRFEAWANTEGGYGVAVAICKCGHASTF
jgi:hypothetical protein